jgi:hypothetical protein
MSDAFNADVAVKTQVVRNTEVDAFIGLTPWTTHAEILVLIQEVLDDEHLGNSSDEVVIALEQWVVVCLKFKISSGLQVLFTQFFSLFLFLRTTFYALPFDSTVHEEQYNSSLNSAGEVFLVRKSWILLQC